LSSRVSRDKAAGTKADSDFQIVLLLFTDSSEAAKGAEFDLDMVVPKALPKDANGLTVPNLCE